MASVLQLCCAACESQDWICLVHYICRAMSDSSSSVRLSSYAVLVACGQLIAALYWLLPCDGGFSSPITTSKVLERSKLPKRPDTHFTNPTAFFFRVILFLFLVQHQRKLVGLYALRSALFYFTLYFHLIFFTKAEVSIRKNGSFLANLAMLHLIRYNFMNIKRKQTKAKSQLKCRKMSKKSQRDSHILDEHLNKCL